MAGMDPAPFPVAQQVQLWTSAASYIAAIALAAGALFQYRKSKKLERAKWMLQLYEKFYEDQRFKRMRDILDCAPAGNSQVQEVVQTEESEFTDYLNFFEFVSYLTSSGQLDDNDVEALFAYYMDCLYNHEPVRSYIFDASKGFQHLSKALEHRRNSAPRRQYRGL